jgi:aminopeptidase
VAVFCGRVDDMAEFAANLERYMDVILRIGVNLQPGQPVTIGGRGVPLEFADVVRLLARRAYDLGASSVKVTWTDPVVDRMWFERASTEALQTPSKAQVALGQEFIDDHAAFIGLIGADPDAFAGVDPARMGVAMQAQSIAASSVQQQLSANVIPWVGAALATPAWARKVFPDKTPGEALTALWNHIFHATRVDTPDPVATWKAHVEELTHRVKAMDSSHFARLRYRGPGTDLTLELPARHRWLGGGATDSRGVFFVPNLPTEEVFSAPHRTGVHGTVHGTMPVLLQGAVVNGVSLRFEDGRIVEYDATQGREALGHLIETDEGSHYLGEVALVTSDSPTFATFPLYNTLYDENVSCHLAIGNAYPACIEGAQEMTPEQLVAAGANSSAAHWDFMVGSPELEIDGEAADGQRTPIIRNGAWMLR